MEILEVIDIVSSAFKQNIEDSDYFMIEYVILKDTFNNDFAAIKKHENETVEVTFFKSSKKDDFFEDYNHGTTFYPKSIENLQIILDCLNV